MPAAELAGDHLVVSCQVRRTQGAAVYALRLDVAQKEAAHSASCPPARPQRPMLGLDWGLDWGHYQVPKVEPRRPPVS